MVDVMPIGDDGNTARAYVSLRPLPHHAEAELKRVSSPIQPVCVVRRGISSQMNTLACSTYVQQVTSTSHFHYERVTLGHVQVIDCRPLTSYARVQLAYECQTLADVRCSLRNTQHLRCLHVRVSVGRNYWRVHRTYEQVRLRMSLSCIVTNAQLCHLDELLHSCIFRRSESGLPPWTLSENDRAHLLTLTDELLSFKTQHYFNRLSDLFDNRVTCNSVLRWFEVSAW